MFPWTCLVELPLFYAVDWPRKIQSKFVKWIKSCRKKPIEPSREIITESQNKLDKEVKPEKIVDEPEIVQKSKENILNSEQHILKEKLIENQAVFCDKCSKIQKDKKIKSKQRLTVLIIFCYIALQLFLPFSHFITKGYNGWTNGLYGYSWDMMMYAWDTVLISIKVIDNSNQNEHYLDPNAFVESDRWSKHPDMAYQYAQCINERLKNDFLNEQNEQSLLKSDNLSIYFDVWASMNGRFQQRFFNPKVDLVKADWSPFRETPWIVPILKELTNMRPKLNEITNNVLYWNNFTDLLFIADFPGFKMDHYIPKDLTNVTLTVLEGTVEYTEEKTDKIRILHKDNSLLIKPKIFHRISVVSETPASYMFTYLNQTLQNLDESSRILENDKRVNNKKGMLPLWTEFKMRYMDYKRFIVHIGNAILHEIYGIPMPRRSRHVKIQDQQK